MRVLLLLCHQIGMSLVQLLLLQDLLLVQCLCQHMLLRALLLLAG